MEIKNVVLSTKWKEGRNKQEHIVLTEVIHEHISDELKWNENPFIQ